MRPVGFWLFISMLLAAVPAKAAAQDSIQEMYHKSWTARDGAPSNIESIAATTDGLIWIATDSGLYFFDGISFERFVPPAGSALLSDSLYGLSATPDGSLWVCYLFGGLTRVIGGRVTNYTEMDGLQKGQIRYVTEDPDESFWISGAHGIQQLRGSRLSLAATEGGLPVGQTPLLTVDREENQWLSIQTGLFVRLSVTGKFRPAAQWRNGYHTCAPATKGVWCWGNEAGVERFEFSGGNVLRTFSDGKLHAYGLATGSDGSLWIASSTNGVLHLAASDLSGKVPNHPPAVFGAREGLSGNYAFQVVEDREGSIWVATTKGLDQFRPMPFHKVILSETAPVVLPHGTWDTRSLVATDCLIDLQRNPPACVSAPYVHEWTRSLYHADDGAIWIGTSLHLWRYTRERFTEQPLPPDLGRAGTAILAIVEDDAHRIWISIGGGNGLFQLNGQQWIRWGGLSGLPAATAYAAIRDHAGGLWFGYDDGRAARIAAGRVQIYEGFQGFDIGPVKVFAIRGEEVWAGGDAGVSYYRAGKFMPLRLEGGQAFRGVTGLAFAPNGSLWISQSDGVIRIDGDELNSALRAPGHSVRGRRFDSRDGLQGIPHPMVGLGSAWLAPDGKLYIATRTNLQWIDPLHLPHNDIPPQVLVTHWQGDDLAGEWPSLPFMLKPRMNELEIRYTATSLLIPDRVRFRYRLDGYDRDWIDAGTRREAFYSHLPPGQYTFHVIAANNDGVWNEAGATVGFTVLPAFTQTVWFRLGVAIAILMLGWQIYSWRLGQMRARVYDRMNERMAERERIARDLHDTFLQSVQGLLLRFHTAASKLDARDPARSILDNALSQSDQVMAEGRRVVFDLRAISTEGGDLPGELAKHGRRMAEERDCDFELIVNGAARPMHPLIFDEIAGIGKEAIGNAVRHSGAQSIEAELNYEPAELRMCIRDNGSGIDPDVLRRGYRQGHWGLPGMRERASRIRAELNIWSGSRAGTEIELRLAANLAYSDCDNKARDRKSAGKHSSIA